MASKPIQRLIGVLMILIGIGFVVYGWQKVLAEGVYWPKASFIFPALAFVGLAIFLYPMSKEECLERYGVEKPQSWSHFNGAQKSLIVLGFAAGALNWAFISGTLRF